MSVEKKIFYHGIIPTGVGGILLLCGIGNLIEIGLPNPPDWPDIAFWGLSVVLPGVGWLVGYFLTPIIFKNAVRRFICSVLFCVGCALEFGILGIAISEVQVWEGGIPTLPLLGAIIMTIFGGIFALLGIITLVFDDDIKVWVKPE